MWWWLWRWLWFSGVGVGGGGGGGGAGVGDPHHKAKKPLDIYGEIFGLSVYKMKLDFWVTEMLDAAT